MSGNKMALDALKFAEAALADIGDADREPGDDLAWCEARAAEALPRTRAAIAVLQAEPQPAPVHPNHRADLRYVRKVLDDVRSLALTEGDKLCGDVDAAINGMDYIIKRTEEAACIPATPPKD